MKKLVCLSIAFLLAMSSAHAQYGNADKEKVNESKKGQKSERTALRKLEGSEVSKEAKSNFIIDFPDVSNVQSKRVNTYDEFQFLDKNGKLLKAYYDFNGKLVGTTQEKTLAELPAKSQEEIKKLYPDYTVEQVIFYDDNEENDTDMILFGIQFDDADNYFVGLSKGNKKVILEVNMKGNVSIFKEL
jgi:hypothetical protein